MALGETPGKGRPDPDELLARVQQDEVRAGRGRLKIFFGASAGVGKTCAMLAAARTAPWVRQFSSSDDWVIVSNLLPTSPLFAALAMVDGVTVEPRLRFANTGIFRRPACASCTRGDARPPAHWSIQVKGALPDSTSIVTLPAP